MPWRERGALALLVLLVFATRLPFIGSASGYGSDPDSYRVVSTARLIARTGEYQASRLPGYPAYEYLTALSARSAPWVSNAVTAACSAMAALLLALILRYFGVPRYGLLAVALAMTPVIYLNSCSTIDYIPAVACMLAACYAVLCRRAALGGVLLGVAVGCRITSGALAAPLCLWMLLNDPGRAAVRACLVFGATTLVSSALIFLPVYLSYGFGFFAFYDNRSYPPLDVVYARALPLVWGQLGGVALLLLLCALPLNHRHVRRALRVPRTRHALALAAAAVALYLIAFLRLPDEPGYLVPAVPFVLLAIALLAPPWTTLPLTTALALSSVVAFHHGVPAFDGPVVEDHLVRLSQQRSTLAVLDAVARLPEGAVIVSGWELPRIYLALGGDRQGAHQFIYLIENLDDYHRYEARGHRLYYLPGVDLYESQAHELELADLGARQLDVPIERQRPASTGE
jgi:hypothetical protein